MIELTYKIRGCIFEVFKELDPGLLESVYESALVYEILNKGLKVEAQVPLPVKYKSIELIRIVNNYSSADSAFSARNKNISS